MPNLSTDQLRRLARLGAVARLEQLRAEETAIRAEFPELFGRGRRPEAAAPARTDGPPAARKRSRRKMSAQARKAVSVRMRKYWAERRKSKAAK